MPYHDSKITLTNAHGTFETGTMRLDRMIATHLPASPNEMRLKYEAAVSAQPGTFADLSEVSDFLIMFAELEA